MNVVALHEACVATPSVVAGFVDVGCVGCGEDHVVDSVVGVAG